VWCDRNYYYYSHYYYYYYYYCPSSLRHAPMGGREAVGPISNAPVNPATRAKQGCMEGGRAPTAKIRRFQKFRAKLFFYFFPGKNIFRRRRMFISCPTFRRIGVHNYRLFYRAFSKYLRHRRTTPEFVGLRSPFVSMSVFLLVNI